MPRNDSERKTCPLRVPPKKNSPFLMRCGAVLERWGDGTLYCPQCRVGWSDGKEPEE